MADAIARLDQFKCTGIKRKLEDAITSSNTVERDAMPSLETVPSLEPSPLEPSPLEPSSLEPSSLELSLLESSLAPNATYDASQVESETKEGEIVVEPTLSVEQKEILDRVCAGHSVLITGLAGTGKSFLLRHIIEALPKENLFTTGSTGIAAVNVGGVTLHSFAGVGLAQEPVLNLVQKLVWNDEKRQNWINCKTLIIDEISMVSAEFFEKLDGIARIARSKPALPFGGIQLVLTGDFLQLPPIVKKVVNNADGDGNGEGEEQKIFCFETDSWKACVSRENTFLLKRVFRQSDSEFVNLLSKVRRGFHDEATLAPLYACVGRTLKCDLDGMEATKICTHKVQVNQENATRLAQLKGSTFKFTAKDTGEKKLLHHVQAPPLLELKVGAQVMLLKNLDVQNGLCNGTCGIVTSFQEIAVPTSNGEDEEPNVLQDWLRPSKKQKKLSGIYPIVTFENGVKMPIVRSTFEIKVGDERVAARNQLPLMLAWAVTVHKSQGKTLRYAQVYLERHLSRAKCTWR